MVRRISPLAVLLIAGLFLGTSVTADDTDKKPDEKKVEKPAPAKPEKAKPKTMDDLMTRALAWARKFGKDHKGLARLTAFPSNATEDENITIFIEFGNGNLALYQGNADPDADSYVVLEKGDLPALKEAMERSQAR